ncbi:MAG: hypothetical protein NZL85_02455, partial [Fimbriimonadales bacterium]|nr:hypothetical protein [Fimbriimonadales bacterium]
MSKVMLFGRQSKAGKQGSAEMPRSARHDNLSGGRSAAEPPIRVRVLVLNFDPLVQAEGGKPLHRVLGWNDPRQLAQTYARD